MEKHPDNLFKPAEGDYTAREEFGNEALSRSPELWISEHKGWLWAAFSVSLPSSLVWKRARA